MRAAGGPALQPLAIGWYGKLASRGDFLGRGLPPSWQGQWDDWLQRAMAQATRAVGSPLLRERLLAMAPWHGLVLPEGHGEPVWSGVVAATGDRVGRVFPLLLAEAYDEGQLDTLALGALQSRAWQLAGWLRDGALELAPREFEAGVAHWSRSPLTASLLAADTGATLNALRQGNPGARSFWWRLEMPLRDDAPALAEPWPPREALLLEWLAVSD